MIVFRNQNWNSRRRRKRQKMRLWLLLLKWKRKKKWHAQIGARGTIKRRWIRPSKIGWKKTGDRLDTNGEVISSMYAFCSIVQIHMNKFQKYVRIDPNARRIITDGVGRKPIIQKKNRNSLLILLLDMKGLMMGWKFVLSLNVFKI